MGNIVNDIVDEIDVKPNRTKLILKWVLGVSGSLIAAAFIFGQIKMKHLNRLDSIETEMLKQTTAINEIKANNIQTNTRIDKVYDEGFTMFSDFQEYNKLQLELIIDYGQDNKELLKKMLEVNSLEREQSMRMRMEQAKTENPQPKLLDDFQPTIGVKPYEPETEDYRSLIHFIEVEGNDTIFNLTAAKMSYIDKIDRNIYEVGAIIENPEHAGLYDVTYKNK